MNKHIQEFMKVDRAFVTTNFKFPQILEGIRYLRDKNDMLAIGIQLHDVMIIQLSCTDLFFFFLLGSTNIID